MMFNKWVNFARGGQLRHSKLSGHTVRAQSAPWTSRPVSVRIGPSGSFSQGWKSHFVASYLEIDPV